MLLAPIATELLLRAHPHAKWPATEFGWKLFLKVGWAPPVPQLQRVRLARVVVLWIGTAMGLSRTVQLLARQHLRGPGSRLLHRVGVALAVLQLKLVSEGKVIVLSIRTVTATSPTARLRASWQTSEDGSRLLHRVATVSAVLRHMHAKLATATVLWIGTAMGFS